MPGLSDEEIAALEAAERSGKLDGANLTPDANQGLAQYKQEKSVADEGGKPSSIAALLAKALPAIGAGVGAGLGGGLLSIPGAAAGGMAGRAAQRVVETAAGQRKPLDPTSGADLLDAGKDLGREGLIAGGSQIPFALLAKYLSKAAPLISELPNGKTTFENLSEPAFNAVHQEATLPARRMVTPPIGDAAVKGAKLATPAVAGAARTGSKVMRRIGEDAEKGANQMYDAARGRWAAGEIRPEMRMTVNESADASKRALNTIREELPARPMDPEALPHPSDPRVPDAPVSGPALPPGEDVVSHAFNEPYAQNSIVSSRRARQALADVSDPAARLQVLGEKLKEAEAARLGAAGLRTQGRDADTMLRDGLEIQSKADAILRQRSGASQPAGRGWGEVLNKLSTLVNNPSSKMGFRPESLEEAALNNSARLTEIEASRRGLPPLDNLARQQALEGMERGPLVTRGIPAAGGFADVLKLFIPDYAQKR